MGTPGAVADQLAHAVAQRAADGFILVPAVSPGGLDEFVDQVVPELQDRGVYRDAYPATTLHGNLGLPEHRSARTWAQARNSDSKVSTLS